MVDMTLAADLQRAAGRRSLTVADRPGVLPD